MIKVLILDLSDGSITPFSNGSCQWFNSVLDKSKALCFDNIDTLTAFVNQYFQSM